MRADWRKAAIDGDAEALAGLIAAGAPSDARDRFGQTALMLASLHGREDVVALLLADGADLAVTAKFGLSALMLAIVNHHEGIARRLIDAGADASPRGTGAPGFAGKTASDLAEERGLTALGELLRRVSAP